MADSARFGLQSFPSARVNSAQGTGQYAAQNKTGSTGAVAAPQTSLSGASSAVAAYMASRPHTSSGAAASAATTAAASAAAAAAATIGADGAPTTGRLSGGKRDHDRAAATDVVNAVSGSAVDAAGRPSKKQKITYHLPSQNMEEGHFYVVLGEDVDVSTARFKILSLLGEGTFGKVVEAWDRKHKMHCAVKIVRNVPKYTRDAQIEIRYMERLRQADPDDRFCFMKILRYFQNDQKHMCIVMPKYGPCLLDFLQKHGPFGPRALAELVFQSGVGLDYFHTELRLMHTDLKPENLLLESDATMVCPLSGKTVARSPVKMRFCDLGGCSDERHSRNAIVSTRHYRSPEVILGLGWMFSTDMWSMGCIFYELYTGKLLYDTHDNLEHLHLFEKTLGRLPAEWAHRCMEETRNLFTPSGALRPLTDPKHIARVARARPLREVIADKDLCDLIVGCLAYDRPRRMTAREVAMHPFVLRHFPEAAQHPQFPANRVGLPPTNY